MFAQKTTCTSMSKVLPVTPKIGILTPRSRIALVASGPSNTGMTGMTWYGVVCYDDDDDEVGNSKAMSRDKLIEMKVRGLRIDEECIDRMKINKVYVG